LKFFGKKGLENIIQKIKFKQQPKQHSYRYFFQFFILEIKSKNKESTKKTDGKLSMDD